MYCVFKYHGLPTTIVSDREPLFLSRFWQEFFKIQGVELHKSTAFHPQTDGQLEVDNQTSECYLRSIVGGLSKSWSKWLIQAKLWYNTTYHSTVKISPFQALHGVPPPIHLPYFTGDALVAMVVLQFRDRSDAIEVLKQNMIKAQAHMKQQANKHRSDRKFDIIDLVYIKLQPYKQNFQSIRNFLSSLLNIKGHIKLKTR